MPSPSVSVLVAEKLRRLGRGEPLRVLDLFGGCGGISLGFQRAGCEILGGVEQNADAARTHARNFHRGLTDAAREPFERARDITEQDPAALLREFGHPDAARAVDVIVGGPPCQAFARVGRAKLRDVKGDEEAFKNDDRAALYEHYVRFVEELAPVALLLENVPDILSFGGRNVAEDVAADLERLGYVVAYTLLNAAAYGVPQTRERFYLLAWREELSGAPPRFPEPTRRLEALPVGYLGTRAIARRLAAAHEVPQLWPKRPNRYDPCRYHALSDAGPPVNTREAMDDLPPITGHLGAEPTIRRGTRRFQTVYPYRKAAPPGSYADLMRNSWRGFTNTQGVKDHVIRALPRDYPIFADMVAGEEYPAAHARAVRLCAEEAARMEQERGSPLPDPERSELTRRMVPPYDASKFPNKWRKLDPDAPARTLMAHLSHDSYSHIHYSDAQARTISVREAARLQSFPDGFEFVGTMNPAFKMIGNAVPPLMAFELAKSLLAQLHAVANQHATAVPESESAPVLRVAASTRSEPRRPAMGVRASRT